MRCHLQISSYRIDLVSVNGPISPKQCYYEMDYSFYSFYWLDSLQIRLDHNSTYYRPLSKNSDVKPRISHCDSQNLQYKTHPEFWPSHRRIFKTSLYYKARLILETRRYILFYCYSLSLLSFGWFVIAVCGSVSVWELVKWLEYFVNWFRVTAPMTSQLNGCPHFFCISFFFNIFFLEVNCDL